MPTCAAAFFGRFPEGLVQLQYEAGPDELRDDGEYLRVKGKRFVDVASVVERNHLKILRFTVVIPLGPIFLNDAVYAAPLFQILRHKSVPTRCEGHWPRAA